MPELPEVETVCRHIRPYIKGHTIKKVIIKDARMASARIKTQLKGQKIVAVERRAKFIVIKLKSGAALVVHLGMTGSLLFKPARFVKVVFELSGGKKLYYSDIRLFGKIRFYEHFPLFKDLGPEPLDLKFSARGFYAALKARKTPIKNLLLNQKFMAGIGNIYAIEALHAAGIHPARRADKLSLKEARDLLSAIRRILKQSIKLGGTTISDFVNSEGKEGGFQRYLKAYGREGQLCKRCRSPIVRTVMGQRGTYYCPKCQR